MFEPSTCAELLEIAKFVAGRLMSPQLTEATDGLLVQVQRALLDDSWP